ncbi:hypothetical protein ABGB18_11395 [Nonomuraea sp. B12E4]|uniref:hypothetical protein n=1 Tax=Nonomuraea sp. B12E4 TaxID=3153564 RepID=UPI00325E53F8
MAPTIRLRQGVNEKLKKHFNCSTDGAVAKHIGVNASTWSRAVRRVAVPGPKLSDALLSIDGFGFEDLFEIHMGEPERESA